MEYKISTLKYMEKIYSTVVNELYHDFECSKYSLVVGNNSLWQKIWLHYFGLSRILLLLIKESALVKSNQKSFHRLEHNCSYP